MTNATASKQKSIELLEEHEHAGRVYPPKSKLTIDADSADWLIAMGKAKEIKEPKS